MKILFIGDIVGKSGRDIVSSTLSSMTDVYDLIIANAENSAHGKGITLKIYRQLLSCGIDYLTMGNHTYSKQMINDHMDEMDRLIVPYNHEKRTTDNYYKIIDCNGIRICLCNILGFAFMTESNLEPYPAFEKILEETKDKNIDFYMVDLHGEATSEKRLFLEYFKKKAKIVIGTHTHVQTADADMIGDCAFISDAGMCGTYYSIIGRDIQETIDAYICKQPTGYSIAEGPAIFCAVAIDVDETEKIPVSIERIRIKPKEN
ncbi:MAG: YmdB family metallophosphoesterase [Erysipelotrichaceae bacterium]|nr:YmdB family metallophosphoesterase [Erysipelotrichaceae bacterium]